MEMKAKTRRLKMEQRLDIVFVDYIQLMRTGDRFENRNQEMSIVSRSLKELAKELRIPVVGISQLSRAPEKGRREPKPMLSDLRESGAIEQDADVVIFIYRHGVLPSRTTRHLQGVAEVNVAKQRNGPIGNLELAFIREYARSPTWNRSRRSIDDGPGMKDKTVFICQTLRRPASQVDGPLLRPAASGTPWSRRSTRRPRPAPAAYAFAPAEPVLYKDIQDIRAAADPGRDRGVQQGPGRRRSSGSLVLIGGEPGIGKSTLLLQVGPGHRPETRRRSSTSRARSRWSRSSCGATAWASATASSISWPRPVWSASWPRPNGLAPKVLVVDSVQTVFSAKLSSGPGTISQVREVANQIFRFAKTPDPGLL